MQTNGTKNFSHFGKNTKKVIPRKILLLLRKISSGRNHPISILPGITRFSIQMVSTYYLFFCLFSLSVLSQSIVPGLAVHPILCLLRNPRAICLAVTNISSCRVKYTTCWWEIRQQWISFGSVFLLVNHEISEESHAS